MDNDDIIQRIIKLESELKELKSMLNDQSYINRNKLQNLKQSNKYHNDPTFHEQMKQRSIEQYRKKKEKEYFDKNGTLEGFNIREKNTYKPESPSKELPNTIVRCSITRF